MNINPEPIYALLGFCYCSLRIRESQTKQMGTKMRLEGHVACMLEMTNAYTVPIHAYVFRVVSPLQVFQQNYCICFSYRGPLYDGNYCLPA
jgi:hypothetical protein